MSINTIIPAAFLLLFQIPCFAISNSTQLSAYYESRNNSIRLKWQNNDNRITIFVLQKSMDNIHWKDLYTIEKRGFNQHLMEAYTDGNPFPANNHYRLKINREDNSFEYSLPITIHIGKNAGSWDMYPVPVGTVLNFQYTGSELITSAIHIIIQNSGGQVLCRLRSATVSRTIQVPVDNLGRGIYYVKIIAMNKTIWSRQIIK